MNPNTIDTIVFDLGGVLINWNPRNLYRKIFDTEEEVTYFLEHICTMDWNEQQDAGRPWSVANALLIERYPEYQTQIEAYFGRWPEMLGGAIQGTVDILEQFYQKQDYRLYALTNWSAETFPIARQRFPFLQYFKGILVSGEEQLKKPDDRIYQRLFDRYAIAPERAVFIDDSLKNIQAAELAQMKTIHFTSPEQLSTALIDLGISQ